MPYVLEKITLEDREKIIKDAACDAAKQRTLIYTHQHQGFPKAWAIDWERNCYLFRTPPRERPRK